MPTTIQPTSNQSPPTTAGLLQSLYAPVAEELAAVEALLKAELRSDYPFVDELVRYGCLLGGKRLRPALLLLTAKAVGGQITHEHRTLATVNTRWDNEASVLLGDFLFTHAFYLASTLDSVLGCRLIGRATNIVCEGELRQKGSRGNFQLGEAEYLEIVEAKTAELTAVSCRLGAMFAGADEALAEQMDGFGRDLGIAFQIADDLLDVQGEEKATGKSLGTDLEKQKPTLPIIRALHFASEAKRRELIELLSGDDRQPAALAPYLEACGAIEYTRTRALSYAHRARRRLDGLPGGPSRDVLAMMSEFVVNRSM